MRFDGGENLGSKTAVTSRGCKKELVEDAAIRALVVIQHHKRHLDFLRHCPEEVSRPHTRRLRSPRSQSWSGELLFIGSRHQPDQPPPSYSWAELRIKSLIRLCANSHSWSSASK